MALISSAGPRNLWVHFALILVSSLTLAGLSPYPAQATTSSYGVSATIPVGSYPIGVAVNETTNTIYVANYSYSSVSVINGSTGTLSSTISVAGNPVGLAVNKTTNKIYVANASVDLVSVIDGVTGAVTNIAVGDSPEWISVNETTNKIYVANYYGDSVSVINGANNTVSATISVGTRPTGVAVNETTNTIYVANYQSNTVSVISGASGNITSTISTSGNPNRIAVNKLTNTIYVSNANGNSLSVISGLSTTITSTIVVGTTPQGIAVDSNTNTIFVANHRQNSVSVIDGASGLVASSIGVASGPFGIAVNKTTNKVYVTNSGDNLLSVLSPLVAPAISTTTLPATKVGDTYSATIALTAGTTATFSVASGSLPLGLLLNSATGLISGNPLSAGTVSFTISATNAGGSDSKVYSVDVSPATVPSAPGSVSASSGNAQALVSWSAPASTGGAAITEYQVRAYDSSDVSRSVCTATMPAALTCQVTGLTNGLAYTFAVFAYNSVGYGAASVRSSAVTPLTKPGPPTGVQAASGNASALVTWLPPSDDGGSPLTSFTVTASPGGQTCTATSPSTICAVPSLTNGQAYTFTVTARTAAFATVGASNASTSSSSVTPQTTPGAPNFSTLTPGNGLFTAGFTSPTSDGGSAITGYEYSRDNGATWQGMSSSGTSSPQTISGLLPGVSYTVILRALNSVGAGPASNARTATFVSAPSAPIGLTGVAGDAGVALSWNAPTSTGGSTIISYTATASPGGGSCTVLAPSTTCDITGLTNGQVYTFTVRATNNVGVGLASVPSATLTPASPVVNATNFTIVIAVAVGDPVAGGSADFSSRGLEPGSPWSLVVHSNPMVLTSGSAGVAGTILGNAVIPTGLEPGWHALTLSGRDFLGREASSTTWFEINGSGELVRTSSTSPEAASPTTIIARIAQTGSYSGTLVLLATLLLTAGILLVRRRDGRSTTSGGS